MNSKTKKQPTKRYHLILDAVEVNENYLKNKNLLKNLCRDICKLIKMKILYGPIVKDGTKENPGLSALCIIDFSHISIHTFTKDKEFCLDIFSCKPFNFAKVENYVIEKFKIKREQIFKSTPEYEI